MRAAFRAPDMETGRGQSRRQRQIAAGRSTMSNVPAFFRCSSTQMATSSSNIRLGTLDAKALSHNTVLQAIWRLTCPCPHNTAAAHTVLSKALQSARAHKRCRFQCTSLPPPSHPSAPKSIGHLCLQQNSTQDGAQAHTLHPHASSSSGTPRKYNTLLHRMRTSPRLPEKLPSIHSSVLASCRFM